ncbi:hypothetical protein RSAG8_01942, partial [Rhizoctonia solani AG-8 WAC10335]
MYSKRMSGPCPLSCITFRERTHPACNRCKAGGVYASDQEKPVPMMLYRSRPRKASIMPFEGSEYYTLCVSTDVNHFCPISTTTGPVVACRLDWPRQQPISCILPDDSGCSHVNTRSTNQLEHPSSDYGLESNSHSPNHSGQPTHRINNSVVQTTKTIQLDPSVYLGHDTSAVAAEYITSQS